MPKEQLKRALGAKLKKIGFSNTIGEIEGYVRNLRNERIAHLLEDIISGTPSSQDYELTLSEMERLIDETIKVFEQLTFRWSTPYLPLQYSGKQQEGATTDVARALTTLAKRSDKMR